MYVVGIGDVICYVAADVLYVYESRILVEIITDIFSDYCNRANSANRAQGSYAIPDTLESSVYTLSVFVLTGSFNTCLVTIAYHFTYCINPDDPFMIILNFELLAMNVQHVGTMLLGNSCVAYVGQEDLGCSIGPDCSHDHLSDYGTGHLSILGNALQSFAFE